MTGGGSFNGCCCFCPQFKTISWEDDNVGTGCKRRRGDGWLQTSLL